MDAPKRLVVRGLYRLCRNPMYVGVLTVTLGWATWFRSPHILLYTAAVATVFHLWIVLYEEPHLLETFGDDYARYRERVPRWSPGRTAAGKRAAAEERTKT